MRLERLFALAHRVTVGAALGALTLFGGPVARASVNDTDSVSREVVSEPREEVLAAPVAMTEQAQSELAPIEAAPAEPSEPAPDEPAAHAQLPVPSGGGPTPVGMCGARGQSIEAPPPIYPTPLATLAGCALGGEEFSALSSTRSGDQIELSAEQPTDSAILRDGVTVASSPSARAERPEEEFVATEEHRARRRRPPRD